MTTTRRRLRRRVTMVLVFVSLGAITSMLSAWIVSATGIFSIDVIANGKMETFAATAPGSDPFPCVIAKSHAPGWEYWQAISERSTLFATPGLGHMTKGATHLSHWPRHLPVPDKYQTIAINLGWPRTSMGWTESLESPTPIAHLWNLTLFGRTIHLPLRPLWPGFLINIAVYATIFAALWWGTLALRRRRRRRAGRCQSCGYSLTGTTADRCPECGSIESSSHS